MRWLSQAMHRAAAPPQPPRPAARGEPVIREGNGNVIGAAASNLLLYIDLLQIDRVLSNKCIAFVVARHVIN